MSVILAAVISAVVTIVLAVGGWFGARAVRGSQVRKTDAETGRTDAETRRTNAESAKVEAEGWQMLNGGLTARVTALEVENADLRTRLAAADERVERAEALARQCRIDLDDLRRRYNATAAPGGGLMRADPDDRTPDV